MKNTTTVSITVADGGQHGSTRCDKCSFRFTGPVPKTCPSCARFITDVKVTPSFGGSDF